MKILIIAEHDDKNLHNTTQHVIAAAQKFNSDIEVLVAGFNCTAVANIAAQQAGVSKVLHADHICYQHNLAENHAALLTELAPSYNYILAPGTTFGKNILPRAAALVGVGQISDVVEIMDANTFIRPIYAGNALATVQSEDEIKFLTIRTTAFPACSTTDNPCQIQRIHSVHDLELSEFVKLESTAAGERPDLSVAKIVIAGGRGLQTQENFKMLETLATKLHAAIGASRAAVDAGLVPNDLQIGQTGKVVAPELYIAIGISGAIQHLAGMKDSKVIVAINSDPNAPIFQVADYGLVADLFTAVPELIAAL